MNDLQHEGISNELQVMDDRNLQVSQYDRILELAISQGAALDQLGKWMQLKEKYEAGEARKLFFSAKAEFKKRLPSVKKDRTNKQYNSKYASEDSMMNTLNPVLAAVGMETSFEFPKSEDPNMLMVTCILSHESGHRESVTLSGPIDTSGSKNPLQQVKSTITYLRKATYEAVLGIATSDKASDDDGNSSSAKEYITIDQQTEISDLVQEIYEPKPEIFWNYMKVDNASQILASDYAKAKTALMKAKERKAKS